MGKTMMMQRCIISQNLAFKQGFAFESFLKTRIAGTELFQQMVAEVQNFRVGESLVDSPGPLTLRPGVCHHDDLPVS
jgi:hypothetical protein